MNFIIYAPGDYTPNGGGCVALHKLAHNIAELGENTFIVCDSKNPNYKGVQITELEGQALARYGAFVIYPEVIQGNPLNARNVMRWILYNVRNYDNFGVFGERDLIYKYAPMFSLRYGDTFDGELRAVELNLDLFKYRDSGGRSGSVHLYKKMGHKKNIHPEDSVLLDDYAAKGGNQYLSRVFRYAEIFYSYDSATWLSIMAALCGCVSVVVPDANVTPAEWYAKFPYFRYGIAYGMDEVPHALATAGKVRANLLELEKQTILQTKEFIDNAYKVRV